MESFVNVAVAIGFVLGGLGIAVLAGIMLYGGKPKEEAEPSLTLSTETEST